MHLYLLYVIVYTYMHVLAIGSCMPLKVALYNIIPNQERIYYALLANLACYSHIQTSGM